MVAMTDRSKNCLGLFGDPETFSRHYLEAQRDWVPRNRLTVGPTVRHTVAPPRGVFGSLHRYSRIITQGVGAVLREVGKRIRIVGLLMVALGHIGVARLR
jgi:hypothetical protein